MACSSRQRSRDDWSSDMESWVQCERCEDWTMKVTRKGGYKGSFICSECKIEKMSKEMSELRKEVKEVKEENSKLKKVVEEVRGENLELVKTLESLRHKESSSDEPGKEQQSTTTTTTTTTAATVTTTLAAKTQITSKKVYFKGEDSMFSNLSSFGVVIEQPWDERMQSFNSGEEAFQGLKAGVCGNWTLYNDILDRKFTPRQVMFEGKKTWRNEEWEQCQVRIMRQIVRSKIIKHQIIRDALLENHKNSEFVENTPHPFWGRGINNNGKNMLGRLWTEEKDELFQQIAAEKRGGKKRSASFEAEKKEVKEKKVKEERILLLSDSMLKNRGEMMCKEIIERETGLNVEIRAVGGLTADRVARMGVLESWKLDDIKDESVFDGVVLMLGTNDIGGRHGVLPDEGTLGYSRMLASRLEKIGSNIERLFPDSWIGWLPIFRREVGGGGYDAEGMKRAIGEVNARVSRRITHSKGFLTTTYEDDTANNVLRYDGLHPTSIGIQVIARSLEKMIS